MNYTENHLKSSLFLCSCLDDASVFLFRAIATRNIQVFASIKLFYEVFHIACISIQVTCIVYIRVSDSACDYVLSEIDVPINHNFNIKDIFYIRNHIPVPIPMKRRAAPISPDTAFILSSLSIIGLNVQKAM